MVLLVTGAAGFIGAHLVRSLLKQGHEVVGLDAGPMPEWATHAGRLTYHSGNVSDGQAIRHLVHGYQPEGIFHLAYLLPPASEENPSRTLQVNLLGFDNILSAARDAQVRRVVWTSSMAVYGPSHRYAEQPVDEEAPTYPTSLYGATKVMAEALARQYVQQFGMEVVGIRANLVYGPGRVRGLGEFKIWSRDLFEKAARREPVVVPYGDQPLDWVYVTDVVRVLEQLLSCPVPDHQMFNVLGERRPVRDAVEAVRALVPDAPIEVEPGLLPLDRQPPAFDGRRAELALDYRCDYSLDAGARAFLNALAGEP